LKYALKYSKGQDVHEKTLPTKKRVKKIENSCCFCTCQMMEAPGRILIYILADVVQLRKISRTKEANSSSVENERSKFIINRPGTCCAALEDVQIVQVAEILICSS